MAMPPTTLEKPRTFPGDPNPPPDVPEPASAPEAPAPGEGKTASAPSGFAPPSAPAPAPISSSDGAIYRVFSDGEGKRTVYRLGLDGERAKFGTVDSPDAEKVLNHVGQYNENTRSWDVPESAAKSLTTGRLGLSDDFIRGVSGGEAGLVRSYNALNFLNGGASLDELKSRNQPELLKEQLAAQGQPSFAWGGLADQALQALKHPISALEDTAHFVTSLIAGILPTAAKMAEGAAKRSAAVGGPALGAAIASGTVEFPPVATAVAGMFSLGALEGATKTLIDIETGGLAASMADQGLDEKTIKTYAPVGGAVKGMLWMVGYKFLPQVGQSAVLNYLSKSDVIQKAAANWMVKYGGEVAAGTGIMVAQEKIRQVINNMAAESAKRPDLLIPGDKGLDGLLTAAISGFTISAVAGAPGAMKEGLKARADTAAEAKAAAETGARLDQTLKTIGETKPASVPIEGSAAGPTPEPPVVGESGSIPAKPPVAESPTTPKVPTADEKIGALIDGYQAGEVPADKLIAETNKLLAEKPPEAPTPPERSGTRADTLSLEGQTQEVEHAARLKQVESDLADNESLLGDFARLRTAYADKKVSTRLLDTRINSLLDERKQLEAEHDTLVHTPPDESLQGRRAKLSMTPVTLEQITDEWFKAGGKQSQARAKGLLRLAKDAGLTATDVKRLVGQKAIGAMGDVEFRNFMKEFTVGVEKLVERKTALESLNAVRAEKRIVNERYVRQLHALPPIRKMTTEQLGKYADILRQYDANDIALSPARIEALKGTELHGVKTVGEARAKFPQITGRTIEDMRNAHVTAVNAAIPDPHQRGWNPALSPLVDLAQTAKLKGEKLFEAFRAQLHELGSAAIASRRKQSGLGARILDILVPQQREIMQYIEETDPAKKAALAQRLTPEEQKFADFWLAWSEAAKEHLIKNGDMESSRFGSDYIPHTPRNVSEIIRELGKVGLKKSFMEFLPSTGDAVFTNSAGEVLGFRKFFKQTIFRTGELEPSKNIIPAMAEYARQFYRKAALDQSVPVIDTLIRALKPEENSEAARQFHESLVDFTKAFLNNKKGINTSGGMIGALLDPVLRFTQTLASIHYIAGNMALQATIITKESVGEFMALGTDLGVAKVRKHTARGKELLAKYDYFIGKGPLDTLREPGAGVQDFLSAVGYGAFKFSHKVAMQDILLGSMTKEEYKTGVISDARLADIKLNAARWVNLEGMKSITGSSTMGATFTQLKGWAIPPLLSIGEDATALAKTVVGKGKMTRQQGQELLRLGALTAFSMTARSVLSKDMEDDSFIGRAIYYTRRDLITMWQALTPDMFVTAGVGPEYAHKLAHDIKLLVTLEEYKRGEGYKGVEDLQKDLTPAMVKQLGLGKGE